jgi:hypothetical protein
MPSVREEAMDIRTGDDSRTFFLGREAGRHGRRLRDADVEHDGTGQAKIVTSV